MAPGWPGSALTERPAGAGPGPADAWGSGCLGAAALSLCGWTRVSCLGFLGLCGGVSGKSSACGADGANELRAYGVGALPSPHAIVS